MDNSDGLSNSLNDSPAVEVTGQIMVAAIIVLFVVVVFVLFLHLYAKWFWWRVVETSVPSRNSRRRRRFVFVPGQDPSAGAAVRTGLDPSVLLSLPVLIFNPEDFKEGLECAVCLSELAQDEKARLLPRCNHGFHVECIDMWFQSHSTCPLCRNLVSPDCSSAGEDLGGNSGSENSTENLNFPTNVLFWGNQTVVSSRGASLEDGSSSSSSNVANSLVIDIPMQLVADQSSAEEELKSPPVPTPTRLRSLKRLLSKEKRACPCSSSCVEGGEQVGRSQNS